MFSTMWKYLRQFFKLISFFNASTTDDGVDQKDEENPPIRQKLMNRYSSSSDDETESRPSKSAAWIAVSMHADNEDLSYLSARSSNDEKEASSGDETDTDSQRLSKVGGDERRGAKRARSLHKITAAPDTASDMDDDVPDAEKCVSCLESDRREKSIRRVEKKRRIEQERQAHQHRAKLRAQLSVLVQDTVDVPLQNVTVIDIHHRVDDDDLNTDLPQQLTHPANINPLPVFE